MRTLGTILACAALCLATDVVAQTNAFLPTSGDAVVINAQGRSFKGELRGYVNGQVVLTTREGATGEVTRRFNRADVRAITFPGYELAATAADHVANGLWREAREELETLARQRGPYLEVLPGADLGLFFALVDARMRTGGEIDGIALARRLEGLANAADRRAELADAILIGHWQLGLIDEARLLARQWCGRTQPGGPSALGWRILAEIALKEGRDDDALWISLQPIAYASFENPPHLDVCYAIATTAAARMGDQVLATRIRSGMEERGIEWPAGFIEPFASTDLRNSRPFDSAQGGLSLSNGRTQPSAPSKQPDLRLHLDQVRKLIVNPALP